MLKNELETTETLTDGRCFGGQKSCEQADEPPSKYSNPRRDKAGRRDAETAQNHFCFNSGAVCVHFWHSVLGWNYTNRLGKQDSVIQNVNYIFGCL